MDVTFWPTCEPLRSSRLSSRTSLALLTVLLVVISSVNARASDSAQILSISPAALAFARYISFLNQRNPFTESGAVAVEIDASLPGLGKQAYFSAIRETGASERSQYRELHIEGDSMVKREVIARYLSAEAQAEELPLSSTLITPSNYKFRYAGSIQNLGKLLYLFNISARKKCVGLIRGQIWIDFVTGVPVHEAGHFVKTPSVFLRRIDIACDTTLRDGLPYFRITHVAIETRLRAAGAELTITERPLKAPAGEAPLQLTKGER